MALSLLFAESILLLLLLLLLLIFIVVVVVFVYFYCNGYEYGDVIVSYCYVY